jgi:hypothetical protein
MRLEALKQGYSHPRFHPVLITEVTRMQGGHFCAAGWDLKERRMVRPMPPGAKNWRLYSGRVPFTPGQLVNCRAGKPRAGERILPHCNQDFFVAERPWVMKKLPEAELYEVLLETLYAEIGDVFGAELIEQRYLIEGTGVRSLGGIKVQRRKLFFYHHDERLRLHLIDGDGHGHDLAVTCDTLTHYFSPRGEDGELHLGEEEANEWLELNDPEDWIILRIGLARGWAGPDQDWEPKRCYAQLNGLICPRDNWGVFLQGVKTSAKADPTEDISRSPWYK